MSARSSLTKFERDFFGKDMTRNALKPDPHGEKIARRRLAKENKDFGACLRAKFSCRSSLDWYFLKSVGIEERACQCNDGLSATQNGVWQRVSAPCGNRLGNHITRFNETQHSHDFVSIYRKRTEYDLTYLATLTRFFACRIVILGLLKINIKARQDISEFLTANL